MRCSQLGALVATVDFVLSQSEVWAVQTFVIVFGVAVVGLWAHIRIVSLYEARERRLARRQLVELAGRLHTQGRVLAGTVDTAVAATADLTRRLETQQRIAAPLPPPPAPSEHPKGGPVLVVGAVSVRQVNVESGATIAVDISIENIGETASDATAVSVHLRDAAGGEVGAPKVLPVRPLAPNTSTSPMSVDIALPKDLLAGDYHFSASIRGGTTRHSLPVAVVPPAPAAIRPPVTDAWRPAGSEHQVFISFSRDMQKKADEVTELVNRFGRLLKPFNYAYVDPLLDEINGHHIRTNENWQDRIGSPHEHGARLVIVLVGERLGLRMDGDFGRSRRGKAFHARLVRAKLDKLIHVPGCNDDIIGATDGTAFVPLTGLVYELVDTLLDHMERGDQEHRKLLICINGTRDGSAIKRNARLWSEAQLELGATDGLDDESWRAENAAQRKWVGILFRELLGQPQKYLEFVWLENKAVVLADEIRRNLVAAFIGEDASQKIDGLPGPSPFESKHALFFAGRDDELQQLLTAVRDQRQPRGLVSVWGASGTGKSSLVRAGLLARLTSVARRSDGYGVAYLDMDRLEPDDDPFVKLGGELDRSDDEKRRRIGHVLDGAQLRDVGDLLRKGDVDPAISVLNLRLADTTPGERYRLVLIIDHFDTAVQRSAADIASKQRWQQFCQFVLSLGATAGAPSVRLQQAAHEPARLMITSVTTSLVETKEAEWVGVGREKIEVFREPLVDLIYRKIFTELRLQLEGSKGVIDKLASQCADLRTKESILPFVSIGLRRLHEAMRNGQLEEGPGLAQQVLDLCSPTTAIQNEGNEVSRRIDELDKSLGEEMANLPVQGDMIARLRNRASYADLAFRGLMRRVIKLARPVHESDLVQSIEVPVGGGKERYALELTRAQVKGPQYSVAKPMRESRFLADHSEDRISLAHRQILISWDRARSWLHSEVQDLELSRQLRLARFEWQRETSVAKRSDILTRQLMEIGEGRGRSEVPADIAGRPLRIALWRLCDLFARHQQDMEPEFRAFVIESIAHVIERGEDVGKDALLIAASVGDVALVERVAKKSKPLKELVKESETVDRVTAAHFAAQYGHSEVLKQFQASGVDLETETNETKFRPIHLAAQNGQLDAFLYLMNDAHVDINAPAKGGVTPMHFASGLGHDEIVENAIDQLQADLTSEDGSLPLHLAAQNGHAKIVRLLIEKVSNKDAATQSGYTALHLAIRTGKEGHFACAEALLEGGASPHRPFPDGRTTLDFALQENRLKIAALLQARGVVPKPEAAALDRALREENGDELVANLLQSITPADASRIIRQAITEQRSSLVRALVKAGTSFQMANEPGAPLAVVAVGKSDPELVAALLKSDCDMSLADGDGWTALHHAARLGHLGTAQTLAEALSRDVAIDKLTPEGLRALDVAIKHNRVEIAESLVRAGAKVEIATLMGIESNADLFRVVALGMGIATRLRMVREVVDQQQIGIVNALVATGVSFRGADAATDPILISAVRSKNYELVEAILRSDADREAADPDGKTALHHAVDSGATNITKLLIAGRAKIDVTTQDGLTPLHLAAERVDLETARALVSAGARTDIEDAKGRVAADLVDDDDDDPNKREMWRLLSPITLGALVRGRVGGSDGRLAVHPDFGVYFKFGDGSVGLIRYDRIDPQLFGRGSGDGEVGYIEADELFQDYLRFDVYVIGRAIIRRKRAAWDLRIRRSDQRAREVHQ